MTKKTLLTILITFLLTTLFWLLVQEFSARYVRDKDSKETVEDLNKPIVADTTEDICRPVPVTTNSSVANESSPSEASVNQEQLLLGKWKPVEASEYHLEITKYGKIILKGDYNLRMDFEYTVRNGKLRFWGKNVRYKVYQKDGSTYLELYDDAEVGGKYIKTK